jgi:hypothetical protein
MPQVEIVVLTFGFAFGGIYGISSFFLDISKDRLNGKSCGGRTLAVLHKRAATGSRPWHF